MFLFASSIWIRFVYFSLLFQWCSTQHCSTIRASSLRLSPFYHSEPKWISFIFILLFVRRFFRFFFFFSLYSFSLPYIYIAEPLPLTVWGNLLLSITHAHGEKEKKNLFNRECSEQQQRPRLSMFKSIFCSFTFLPIKRMKERNCDAMAWNGIERRNGKGKEEIVYFFYTIKMSERRTAE